MKLSDKEIKTIKYEKRVGIVFSVILLIFAGLFNLFYSTSNSEKNWTLVMLIDIGVIGLSVFISYILNRNLNRDIKEGTKYCETEKITRKEVQTTYDAGSGCLYIPFLGDFFPKSFGRRVKPIYKLNLIINNHRFEVEKEVFDKVKKGSMVDMYYSNHSKILLGIEISKNDNKAWQY